MSYNTPIEELPENNPDINNHNYTETEIRNTFQGIVDGLRATGVELNITIDTPNMRERVIDILNRMPR